MCDMYSVKFYKGNYRDRQREANRDKAVCYVEHHFNSCSDPSIGYCVVIVGSNASKTSIGWGRFYSRLVSREFVIPVGGDDGVKIGGFGGRGDSNIRFTHMPAILLEPLFASNPRHAEIIRDDEGQNKLAEILVESIRKIFPNGGLVAFSVGHKYKKSNPLDRGALLHGGGTEADYAEIVLIKAKDILSNL